MSDGAHLLIPFASSLAPGCGEALGRTPLPNLGKLLSRLRMGERLAGEETSLSMPHERALAEAAGLPPDDGRIPWAAWQSIRVGAAPGTDALAWLTPCHWRVGTDHVAMDVVSALQLHEEESRALLAAMRPYFEEDGIALEYREPTRWLARGEVFRALPTASLDRVEGRVIDGWMPRTPAAGTLRRLQQEMQMLLYTHAINDARAARGLLPVTSFWASGAGALSAEPPPTSKPLPRVIDDLREPALRDDWSAWAGGWQKLDTGEIARVLASARSGAPVKLTLCGERSAQTWRSEGSGGLMRALSAMIAPVNIPALLASL